MQLDGDIFRCQTPGKLLRRHIQTQLPSFDLRIIVDNDYFKFYVMSYAIENFTKTIIFKTNLIKEMQNRIKNSFKINSVSA